MRMFKTLDRYIMRTFLHSLLMWFLVFMMMRIVIDLFVKLDEFTENIDQGGGLWITISSIATHYFYHSFVYFTEMGGIVIVASAVFAVARMNHTNELTAMLASGVSLHRVVWPIIVAAMLFGALIVVDQELIIPNISRQLTLEEDEVQVGKSKFEVRAESDENFNKLLAMIYDPKTGVLDKPMFIFRSMDRKGYTGHAYGATATYGEFQGKKGWFLADGQLHGTRVANSTGKRKIYRNWLRNQATDNVKTKISPEFLFNFALKIFRKENPRKKIPRNADGTYKRMKFPNPEVMDSGFDMILNAKMFRPGKQIRVKRGNKIFIETHSGTLTNPVFTFYSDKLGEFKTSDKSAKPKDNKRIAAQIIADSADWVYNPKDPGNAHWKLKNGKIFVPSDLDPKELELRDSGTYFNYMSSAKLDEIQKANTSVDIHAVRLAMFTRIADPINNVIMLMLGLPFILSRGRNIKMSAALCLLMVGSFYAFIYICRSMGLDDYLSAFLPILIFGPVSLLMLDSIKT